MMEEEYKQKMSLAIEDNFKLLVKKLASEKLVLKFKDRLKPITERLIKKILAEEIQAFYDFLQEQDENIAANRGTAVSALGYDFDLVTALLIDLYAAITKLYREKTYESFRFISDALFNYKMAYDSAFFKADYLKQASEQERLIRERLNQRQ